MKITPRKDEVVRIEAVLMDESLDSATKVAKAVLKEVAALYDHRETWAVATGGFATGPYGSQKDAEKALEALQGAEGTEGWRLVRLAPPGRLQAFLEGAEWPGYCDCKHPREYHLLEGNSRGRCMHPDCYPHGMRLCEAFSERKK